MLCKHPSGGLSCTTFFYGKPIFLLFLFSVCVLFTIFVQNIISPSERTPDLSDIFPYQNFPFYNDLMTRLFALSTTEVSSDAR